MKQESNDRHSTTKTSFINNRPITRWYIKQEEDNKEIIERVLRKPDVSSTSKKKDSTLPKKSAKTRLSKDSLYCGICNFTYTSKVLFARHLQDLHPDAVAFKNMYCKICDHTYSSTYAYREHMRYQHKCIIPGTPPAPLINRDINETYCRPCSHNYVCPSEFRHHMLYFHKTLIPSGKKSGVKLGTPKIDWVNLYCNICEKEYATKYIYSKHLKRIHSIFLPKLDLTINHDIKPIIDDPNNHCAACDKIYKTKYSYRIHLSRFHKIKVKQTPTGLQIIECNWKKIIDVDPNNYCSRCDKTLACKRGYKRHLSDVHFEDINLRETSPTVDFSSRYCDLCKKSYASNHDYRGHLITAHNTNVARVNMLVNRHKTPTVDEKKRFCDACNKSYARRGTYRRHLAEVHGVALPHLPAKFNKR